MTAANNGLDFVYADKGMGEKTSDPNYDGVFKVPSLRNIELTGPYMHDGRFETLEEELTIIMMEFKVTKILANFLGMELNQKNSIFQIQTNNH